MKHIALQGKPLKPPLLIQQTAVRRPAARQRDRTGVGAEKILHPLPGRHMGVAGEQDLGAAPGRGIVGAVPVAVGEKDGAVLPLDDVAAGEAGQTGRSGGQPDIAVALDPEDLRGQRLQQAKHAVGVIAVSRVIRAGIGQVPQQHQLFRLLLPVQVQQLLAEGDGAVEVGCDQSFHRVPPESGAR